MRVIIWWWIVGWVFPFHRAWVKKNHPASDIALIFAGTCSTSQSPVADIMECTYTIRIPRPAPQLKTIWPTYLQAVFAVFTYTLCKIKFILFCTSCWCYVGLILCFCASVLLCGFVSNKELTSTNLFSSKITHALKRINVLPRTRNTFKRYSLFTVSL